MKFQILHPCPQTGGPGRALMGVGFIPYPPSDERIFLAGYEAMRWKSLHGGLAVEICGGHGELAARLARAEPYCRVIGTDLYIPDYPDNRAWLKELPNLSYQKSSAFDLSFLPPASVDLLWGQAALHHLSHAPSDFCEAALRVLKPGGRLIFIFEPLGHNWLVASIRAIRMSVGEEVDESNLYLSQLRRMAEPFSSCEVQSFNFLGYPMKVFSDRWRPLARAVQRLDASFFGIFPRLLMYGANCNVIFTK